VLGRTNEEYDRLRWQARLLEPATRSVLDRAGLRQGMTCLDVGCGPGEVMRLMAERVGPGGHVVGVDIDGKLAREAASTLASKGLQQCTVMEANIATLEQVRYAPFDFVFARLVLIHLDDPLSAVRKMYGWLKPGGCLVIQDYHLDAIESYPAFEPVYELKRTFFAVCERTHRDARAGLKLPSYFVESGVGAPDGTDVSGHLLPMRIGGAMISAVYRSVLPLALKLGVTTEQRSAWFFEEIAKAQTDDQHMLWPLLVSAWKKKPE
jgi:ubiquinone/menaquinone biosynthesis C-methylase UbiE